jgi:hypothetical protein
MILVISILLLSLGLIARNIPRLIESTRGISKRPLWRSRDLFNSRRDYILFVVGTGSIVAGCVILAVFSISQLW